MSMMDRAFTERVQRLAGAAHEALEVWDEHGEEGTGQDLQDVMSDLRYALQDYLDAGGKVRVDR